ncbi:hypothetical protein FOMPIDRAFT_1046132 [Fomitopsis schrenkii]|uniref:BTB domain-containing protein n=1 Tax=Fomitopsis schrenkii TaxID=2126942 RepID=S8FSS1_FOMSC|nr:hypothetical protein FOMPIDRAFT_1046132 [Fomitopsis schrenkii]
MSSQQYHPSFRPNSDTDVVICSRDGVSFCIRSQPLKSASGWFDKLLTDPKDTPRPTPNEPIHIPEESAVVAGLLKTAFSMEMPPVDAGDLVLDILRAAEYYDMPSAIMLIRACLTSEVSKVSPIRVYVAACERGWQREAEWALSKTIRMDLCSPGVAEELARLDGAAVMKLFVLQRRRRDALRDELDDPSVFDKGNEVPQVCPKCDRTIGSNPWLILKAWWVSRAERVPVSVDDVETLTVQTTADATCPHCRETLYDATHTKSNLRELVQSLPTTTEDNK